MNPTKAILILAMIGVCACADHRLAKRADLSALACTPFATEIVSGVTKTSVLGGVVTTKEGDGLPGADVRVRMVGAKKQLAYTVTDRYGRFSVPELRSGTYQVEVCLSSFNAVVSFVRVHRIYDRQQLHISLSLET